MTRTHWLLCHTCPDLRVETLDGVWRLRKVWGWTGFDKFDEVDLRLDCIRTIDEQFLRRKDFYAKDCRPILRSLSTMTEEEKAEFATTFGYGTIAKFELRHSNTVLFFTLDGLGDCADAHQLFWLLERGFYVGQCPKDEAVIE